jgi:hypothetical protein
MFCCGQQAWAQGTSLKVGRWKSLVNLPDGSYFVCPNGEINAIWYQGNEESPNILRNELEFAFIFSFKDVYCEAGHNLSGKLQHIGEMIIAPSRFNNYEYTK